MAKRNSAHNKAEQPSCQQACHPFNAQQPSSWGVSHVARILPPLHFLGLPYCFHFASVVWLHVVEIYIYIPPHSAICPNASAVFVPVAEWKSATSASCRGWTTMCTSGLSVLVAARKSTTITTCNWWQPSPVQGEWLHQLGKHHKPKVQRSGPVSALVSTGCSTTCNYNHHHQPASCCAHRWSPDTHNTLPHWAAAESHTSCTCSLCSSLPEHKFRFYIYVHISSYTVRY